MSSIWDRVEREQHHDLKHWTVNAGEHQYVAKSTAELRQWFRERRFGSHHFVYDPNLGRWLLARDVADLRDVSPVRPDCVPTRSIALVVVTIAVVVVLMIGAIVLASVSRRRSFSLACMQNDSGGAMVIMRLELTIGPFRPRCCS